MQKEGFIELYGDSGTRNEGLGFFWLLPMNRDKDHNKISLSGFMAVLASLNIYDREEWVSEANMNLFCFCQ